MVMIKVIEKTEFNLKKAATKKSNIEQIGYDSLHYLLVHT